MKAFGSLSTTLDQLADAIRPLTTNEYTARDWRTSGNIGAHVRHCLDHVSALEYGMVTGDVCYDRRERNTVVELDPRLGHSRLRRASARFSAYGDRLLEQPVTLIAQIGSDGASIRVPSTSGRELAFVISHTIHHSALIAVLLEHAGRDVPDRVGLAPTTQDLVCAR
jgi:uncharacterized damage-inducible protein DinB